ncbi:hypothetical protein GpartN1_g6443.t1 [Galdieria partita]|uniref:Uncharacterized protein n=1 Tax=Galdieria partita TaxID=83374 RepID=A0A9C7Q3N2_9RHOD|nr:hypothetical protein GpartN1_g6443.t1 [Galdieria partita]
MQQKKQSLWKTTAEKEAAKLLSTMSVEQLRQQVTNLREKEREQRERIQQVYQSHLADLTKAFKTLMEQKENTKYITQYTQSLYLFCQQWNEQQGTGRESLGTYPSSTTLVDKDSDEHSLRQYATQESIIRDLEECKEDLTLILDSLEQADKDLDSGDFLACQLGLFTMKQRKEKLEQRLSLTTQPLKQFLESLWDSHDSISYRLEKKVSELLKDNANLDVFIGLVCLLLLLLNHEKQPSLTEKWNLFLELRYRCFSEYFVALSSDNTIAYTLEVLEAAMNSVVTTLLTYNRLLEEQRKPTQMETIPNIAIRQVDPNTTVWNFLHQQQEDIDDFEVEVVCEKWLEKVNHDMNCYLEERLKQVVTEQNVDQLSQFFHHHISKLDSLSIDQSRRKFWEQIENLKRIWTMSLVTCIRHLFENILNASFTNSEQLIESHMEIILKNNIPICIQTESYWKLCGDWIETFWMYIDQEGSENRKTFTNSLLESDKCTWEVWMDEFLMKDMNIRSWFDSFMKHLKQLFHQTFPSLLSLLLIEERQSVLEQIQKQILQSYSKFLQSLEKQMNKILPHICLLCQNREISTSESFTKQDFVLSGLVYLYRCIRLLRHENLFPSSIEDIGHEWIAERNQLIMEMERKCRYHLIHHIIYLSILPTLHTQTLAYCSMENISAFSDSNTDRYELDSHYPSESLIQWFMELGKYTQLMDALHFSEDIQILRLLTCSHFMKWLECSRVLENLKDGKLANVSLSLQLYMDLVLLGDICCSQQDNETVTITEQNTNSCVDSKWEEYMSTLETFLNIQNLPSNWKEQLHSNTCFHLDRMGHLFGRLSISSNPKRGDEAIQATAKETYLSPIVPAVARFPYLPAPTPSLLHRHRNRNVFEDKLFDSSETKALEKVSSNIQSKQKKEYTNTSVVDFASQFVGQQMGRFSSKFLESLRTYGGASTN